MNHIRSLHWLEISTYLNSYPSETVYESTITLPDTVTKSHLLTCLDYEICSSSHLNRNIVLNKYYNFKTWIEQFIVLNKS